MKTTLLCATMCHSYQVLGDKATLLKGKASFCYHVCDSMKFGGGSLAVPFFELILKLDISKLAYVFENFCQFELFTSDCLLL